MQTRCHWSACVCISVELSATETCYQQQTHQTVKYFKKYLSSYLASKFSSSQTDAYHTCVQCDHLYLCEVALDDKEDTS